MTKAAFGPGPGNEGTITQMLPANPAVAGSPQPEQRHTALRDRISRGISTAMEKGTASAL